MMPHPAWMPAHRLAGRQRGCPLSLRIVIVLDQKGGLGLLLAIIGRTLSRAGALRPHAGAPFLRCSTRHKPVMPIPTHNAPCFVYQPITDGAGKVSGIFVQGSDVIARKLAQDELKRYQSDLEALVQQRTRALEETTRALQLARELQLDKKHLLRLFEQAQRLPLA
jgi:hypothetical protein